MRDYTPSDRLYLWWLGDPAQPSYVGELHLVRTTRGVSLRYGENWLAHGFALSEDLPLLAQEFLPVEKESAVGAVDDARPDRWGERVIRFVDRPPRLSLLEYLYFAGDDRFGALGVSTSAHTYLPRRLGPLPTLADTQTLQGLVQMVLDNEVEGALCRVRRARARHRAVRRADRPPVLARAARFVGATHCRATGGRPGPALAAWRGDAARGGYRQGVDARQGAPCQPRAGLNRT